MVIQGGRKNDNNILKIPEFGKRMQPSFEESRPQQIPLDPIDITGGADGRNFAFGDLQGKTITTEFIFHTEYDDYLLCTFHTEKVYVAKPPQLRISKYTAATYDGKDFTRQAVNQMLVEDAVGAEDDEVWKITVDYVDGDIITATNLRDVIPIEGIKTHWVEIESNRTWAVVQS